MIDILLAAAVFVIGVSIVYLMCRCRRCPVCGQRTMEVSIELRDVIYSCRNPSCRFYERRRR